MLRTPLRSTNRTIKYETISNTIGPLFLPPIISMLKWNIVKLHYIQKGRIL